MKLGGFLITYNNPKIVVDTIRILFSQTQPPDYIWIIDNSESLDTDKAIASLLEPRLKYHRMGFNAGSAGAAVKGLELCLQSGSDWIYWGDENNPLESPDTFKMLLSIRENNPYCGILATGGYFFDHKKGEIKRVQTRLLEKKESLEVECVAGGMSMLVHRDLILAGVFPDSDLCFGFEELDFSFKAKRRGFAILVHCDLFLELRKKYNQTDFLQPFYHKKTNFTREYYSLRNLLYISDSLTLNLMKKKVIKKWLAKSIYGFKYGFTYGVNNARMIYLAFYHYFRGIKGKTIDL